MSDSEKQPTSASASEFKQNLAEVLELLNQANIPIIVSGDGKPEAVVQDGSGHRKILEAIEQNETVEGVHEDLAGLDESQPVGEAIRSILTGRSSGASSK